ncbi:MAG: 50S ribosomal protein L19 [Candidatus Aureabacteria bacterium]|nr:50S ribosomal protein L19 [Candidatus Auribacterota bacterium]
MDAIKSVEDKYTQDKKIPQFSIGDTLSISSTITGEGKGKRVQTFTGVLIAENGKGVNRTLTLRRISYGEGVEKVIPVYSPTVTKIKVEQHGKVKRSKLYYLRERIGKKATKVKQKDTV